MANVHDVGVHVCRQLRPYSFACSTMMKNTPAAVQKFVGWLTILGGCLLFTSNMDRLFARLTSGIDSTVSGRRKSSPATLRPP